MADGSASKRPGNVLSRSWKALSARARERVILGACLAGALAARDLVLLAGAAAALGLLEVADAFGPRAATPPPAQAS